MEAFPDDFARGADWSVEQAENLVTSLTGVLSARIVTGPTGDIDEVHVLTTQETSPKQTVRNVESALRAHFDVRLDHRKISVAQTSRTTDEEGVPPLPESLEDGASEKDMGASVAGGVADPASAPSSTPDEEPALEDTDQGMPIFVERQATGAEGRILFRGYRTSGGDERPHSINITVALEWDGERFTGEASAAMLPKARLEALAAATLRALERTVQWATDGADVDDAALILDGVKPLEAFDRNYVLVSVHGLAGPEVTPLAGAAPVHESHDHATVLATLQATDRWVRGKL